MDVPTISVSGQEKPYPNEADLPLNGNPSCASPSMPASASIRKSDSLEVPPSESLQGSAALDSCSTAHPFSQMKTEPDDASDLDSESSLFPFLAVPMSPVPRLKEEDNSGDLCPGRVKVEPGTEDEPASDELFDVEEAMEPGVLSEVEDERGDASAEEGLYFECSHCPFRLKFIGENIDEIVKHLTPEERFNQIVSFGEFLNSFDEFTRLNLTFSKKRNIAMIQLKNDYKCSSCDLKLSSGIEKLFVLSRHYQGCSPSLSSKRCPICSQPVKRSLKYHFNVRNPNFCSKACLNVLQRQPTVCRLHAEELKPRCWLCMEKKWPFLGQPGNMPSVCKECRQKSIDSGNLLVKEENACALCGFNCSDEYRYYWPSKFEVVFLGLECVKKLREPLVAATKSRVQKAWTKVRKMLSDLLFDVRFPEICTIFGASEGSKGICFVWEALNACYQERGCRLIKIPLTIQINREKQNFKVLQPWLTGTNNEKPKASSLQPFKKAKSSTSGNKSISNGLLSTPSKEKLVQPPRIADSSISEMGSSVDPRVDSSFGRHFKEINALIRNFKETGQRSDIKDPTWKSFLIANTAFTHLMENKNFDREKSFLNLQPATLPRETNKTHTNFRVPILRKSIKVNHNRSISMIDKRMNIPFGDTQPPISPVTSTNEGQLCGTSISAAQNSSQKATSTEIFFFDATSDHLGDSSTSLSSPLSRTLSQGVIPVSNRCSTLSNFSGGMGHNNCDIYAMSSSYNSFSSTIANSLPSFSTAPLARASAHTLHGASPQASVVTISQSFPHTSLSSVATTATTTTTFSSSSRVSTLINGVSTIRSLSPSISAQTRVPTAIFTFPNASQTVTSIRRPLIQLTGLSSTVPPSCKNLTNVVTNGGSDPNVAPRSKVSSSDKIPCTNFSNESQCNNVKKFLVSIRPDRRNSAETQHPLINTSLKSKYLSKSVALRSIAPSLNPIRPIYATCMSHSSRLSQVKGWQTIQQRFSSHQRCFPNNVRNRAISSYPKTKISIKTNTNPQLSSPIQPTLSSPPKHITIVGSSRDFPGCFVDKFSPIVTVKTAKYKNMSQIKKSDKHIGKSSTSLSNVQWQIPTPSNEASKSQNSIPSPAGLTVTQAANVHSIPTGENNKEVSSNTIATLQEILKRKSFVKLCDIFEQDIEATFRNTLSPELIRNIKLLKLEHLLSVISNKNKTQKEYRVNQRPLMDHIKITGDPTHCYTRKRKKRRQNYNKRAKKHKF